MASQRNVDINKRTVRLWHLYSVRSFKIEYVIATDMYSLMKTCLTTIKILYTHEVCISVFIRRFIVNINTNNKIIYCFFFQSCLSGLECKYSYCFIWYKIVFTYLTRINHLRNNCKPSTIPITFYLWIKMNISWKSGEMNTRHNGILACES